MTPQTPEQIAGKARCEDCRFAHINWRKGDDYEYWAGDYMAKPTTQQRTGTSVQCRINPPAKATRENDYDGWPYVDGDDWCGCFQVRAILRGEP